MPAPILIVEDEPTIADTLLYALKTEGFEPVWCATGGAALDAFPTRPFALVILDVGLPDANGFELCKTLRARSAVPMLFLAARADEIDRIVGLEIGGDDYVTKPFSPREVCARVKAILRRGNGNGGAPFLTASLAEKNSPSPRNGPRVETGFAHDVERCEIRFAGQRLELTRYEYRLLKTMLARPGRVYSRDDLMTQAWEDPGASLDRTVDAHIKTLRAKIRSAALTAGLGEADPIQTHRGLGYSLRTP
jgi:two-component system catabolic regulation response regulator CreB